MNKTINDLPNESRYESEIKLDAVLVDDVKRDMIRYFDITKEDIDKLK